MLYYTILVCFPKINKTEIKFLVSAEIFISNCFNRKCKNMVCSLETFPKVCLIKFLEAHLVKEVLHLSWNEHYLSAYFGMLMTQL